MTLTESTPQEAQGEHLDRRLVADYVLYVLGLLHEDESQKVNHIPDWQQQVEAHLHLHAEDICRIWHILCAKWPKEKALDFLLRGFDCLEEATLNVEGK